MARHRKKCSPANASLTVISALVFICVLTVKSSASHITGNDRPTSRNRFSDLPTLPDHFSSQPDRPTIPNQLSSQPDRPALAEELLSQPDRPTLPNPFSSQPDRATLPEQFSSQPDRPTLPEQFSSQPDRPTLPEQFHVIVEWNDINNNKTVLLEEWYDEHTQKGSNISSINIVSYF